MKDLDQMEKKQIYNIYNNIVIIDYYFLIYFTSCDRYNNNCSSYIIVIR